MLKTKQRKFQKFILVYCQIICVTFFRKYIQDIHIDLILFSINNLYILEMMGLFEFLHLECFNSYDLSFLDPTLARYNELDFIFLKLM